MKDIALSDQIDVLGAAGYVPGRLCGVAERLLAASLVDAGRSGLGIVVADELPGSQTDPDRAATPRHRVLGVEPPD